jgi:hypothetical protein
MAKTLEHEILLRKAVLKIPSSNFGIFAFYKYPAKFIPQVPAFVMENYVKKGMKVFDPFAGFGTVGYTARVYGLEYELWDLNPLLGYFHSLCELEIKPLDKGLIDRIKACSQEFVPSWSNLEYWYPAEFISLLSKAWGFYHWVADEYTKKLLLVPLLRLTKYFSNADEKIYKLYKSRHAKKKVERLLKEDYKVLFYSLLEKDLRKLERRLKEYKSLDPELVNCKVKAGVDVLEEDLDGFVDVLITSPPYLQAQEYIRTTKLELFWLGFTEEYIRSLAKKEIPYRDVPKIGIFSDTYYTYRGFIEEEHLLELYDNYFYALLSVFERLSEKVVDYMFVFVGPAKIRGCEIPIHRIVIEHMEGTGNWVHERTYVDKIVSRVMFSTERNPATGIEDQRIDREYLVVLRRRGV